MGGGVFPATILRCVNNDNNNGWIYIALSEGAQRALQYIITPSDLNNPEPFSVQAAISALEH